MSDSWGGNRIEGCHIPVRAGARPEVQAPLRFVVRHSGNRDRLGCNSYRGIVTFIDVHRSKLNAAFGLGWRRAPAHTAIRYILQGLAPTDVGAAFRQHAARLQAACPQPGPSSVALDGKTLRGSFDNFNDRLAARVLRAFATDTSVVLAHIDIAEKSSEIPAAQTRLAELGVPAGTLVTLDALHWQNNTSRLPNRPTSR